MDTKYALATTIAGALGFGLMGYGITRNDGSNFTIDENVQRVYHIESALTNQSFKRTLGAGDIKALEREREGLMENPLTRQRITANNDSHLEESTKAMFSFIGGISILLYAAQLAKKAKS